MNNNQLKLLKSRFRYYFQRNWWSFIIFLSFIVIIVITIFLIVKNRNNSEKLLFIIISFLTILMTFTIYLFQLELRLVPTLNQVQHIENQFPPSKVFFRLLFYFFISAFLYDFLTKKLNSKVKKPALFPDLRIFKKIKAKISGKYTNNISYDMLFFMIQTSNYALTIGKEFAFLEKKILAKNQKSVYANYLNLLFRLKKTIYDNDVFMNFRSIKTITTFLERLTKANIFLKTRSTSWVDGRIWYMMFVIEKNEGYHNPTITSQLLTSYHLIQENIDLLTNKEDWLLHEGERPSNWIKNFRDNEAKLTVIWENIGKTH